MLLLKLSFSPSLLPTQDDLPDASPGAAEAALAAAPDNLGGGSLSMMGACGGGGGKSSRMEARLLR